MPGTPIAGLSEQYRLDWNLIDDSWTLIEENYYAGVDSETLVVLVRAATSELQDLEDQIIQKRDAILGP